VQTNVARDDAELSRLVNAGERILPVVKWSLAGANETTEMRRYDPMEAINGHLLARLRNARTQLQSMHWAVPLSARLHGPRILHQETAPIATSGTLRFAEELNAHFQILEQHIVQIGRNIATEPPAKCTYVCCTPGR